MKRLHRWLLMLAIATQLATLFGCANSPNSDGYYQRRGTIHSDSFPGTYRHGGYYGYGRPGRY